MDIVVYSNEGLPHEGAHVRFHGVVFVYGESRAKDASETARRMRGVGLVWGGHTFIRGEEPPHWYLKEGIMEMTKEESSCAGRRATPQKGWLKNFFEVASLLWSARMLFVGRFVWQQLLELNRKTNFVADEARSLGMAKKIFAAYPGFSAEDAKEVGICDGAFVIPQKFNEDDKVAILVATVLSDLGKNGDPRWTRAQRALVRRMYAVENVPNGHKLSVADFLRGPYKEFYDLSEEDAEGEIRFFGSFAADSFPEARRADEGSLIGSLARDIPMPQFWSYGHVVWGQGLFPNDAAGVAAALHHVLEGVAPAEVERDGNGFGTCHALVGVIDKYDAFLTRSGMDHSKAVAILASMVGKSMADGGGLATLYNARGVERVADAYREAIRLVDKAMR